jgi:outer membrane murein-binding lipoprotein Lpp
VKKQWIAAGALAVILLTGSVVARAEAERAEDAATAKVETLAQAVARLEANQKQILSNQQTILQELKNLRVWIRRN